MPVESHDAYKPAEIAAPIETAGVAKTALLFHRMATLAMLAGAFIGFGAAFWCMAMVGVDPGFGPQRVLGNVVGGAGGVALAYRFACGAMRG
jgi:formate/nitrite transporter FocA (FNT family)